MTEVHLDSVCEHCGFGNGAHSQVCPHGIEAKITAAVIAERERLVHEGVFTHDGRIMLVRSEEDAAKAVAAEIERLEELLWQEAGNRVEIERLRDKLAMIHEISQEHLVPAWQVIENIAATARSALEPKP